eukprot:TRINITY_DN37599_c0_g1_i1.p1 TRINITY_DN37599_c0_g1~~TRINITY_DN37599_c0_g1_i1.p1  ORF type:complete len:210 (+),score=46.97 TRINITY_DN37599_c0_g1_i1:45-674(+)
MSALARLGAKKAVETFAVNTIPVMGKRRRRPAMAKAFPKGGGMESSLGEDESLRVPVTVVAGEVVEGAKAKVSALQRRMQSAKKEILMVTEDAAKVIMDLLRVKKDHPVGVKVGVEKKGCNGLAYTMDYLYSDYIDANKSRFTSSSTTQHGVTIMVEPEAFMHVVGTVMDYHVDKASEKFVFLNPNSVGSCGCGKSFVSGADTTKVAHA